MDKDTLFSVPVIGALVVGLVIGGFIGMWISDADTPEEVAVSETDETADVVVEEEVTEISMDDPMDDFDAVNDVATIEGSGAVTASDQMAGDVVLVDSVRMENDGWVAIRESADDGRLMNIIGAAFVQAGTQTDISVNVQRPTQSDELYYVTLFTDNGDRTFNYVVDLQLMEGGEIIRDSFIAQ